MLGTQSAPVHSVQWPKATEVFHSRMCSKQLTLTSWTGSSDHHSALRPYDGQRRDLKYLWYWTSFPIWRVSNIFDLQHVHMFIFNPMISVANTKLGIEFEYIYIFEDPKCLKIVRYLCFHSASTKTSFGFCSCSELLKLKFGKNTLQGNANCSAPKTVRGVTKIAY